MLTEVFLSFVVSSGIACLLALAQYIFKSKCDTVECCCIKIHRAVELESPDPLREIELPNPLQRQPSVQTTTQTRGPSLDSLLKK
jgi:hypothetical protein